MAYLNSMEFLKGALLADQQNRLDQMHSMDLATKRQAYERNQATFDLYYPQAQMESESNIANMAAKQQAQLAKAQAAVAAMGAGANPSWQQQVQQFQQGAAQQIPGGYTYSGSEDPTFNGPREPLADWQQRILQGAGVQRSDPLTQAVQQGRPTTNLTQAPASVIGAVPGVDVPYTAGQTQYYANAGAGVADLAQPQGTDPRVQASADAYRNSFAQSFGQYNPANPNLASAQTLLAQMDAQRNFAAGNFKGDSVAAAAAANTGFGTDITGQEQAMRARRIANLDLSNDATLGQLGAVRDQNGGAVHYKGMLFPSEAAFKSFLIQGITPDGAIAQRVGADAAQQHSIDVRIKRELAQMYAQNARAENGIYEINPYSGLVSFIGQTGATPQQIAAGEAGAAEINSKVEASTPAATTAATGEQKTSEATSGGYQIPYSSVRDSTLQGRFPDGYDYLGRGGLSVGGEMDNRLLGKINPSALEVARQFVTNVGPKSGVSQDSLLAASIPTSNGGKTQELMQQLRDLTPTFGSDDPVLRSRLEGIRAELNANLRQSAGEQQLVLQLARKLEAAQQANPNYRVQFRAGAYPAEVVNNPALRQSAAYTFRYVDPNAPIMFIE